MPNHKLKLKKVPVEVMKSICDDKNCTMYNKKAQPGVCYQNDPVASIGSKKSEKINNDYIHAVSRYALTCIRETQAVMEHNLKRRGKKPTLKNKYDYLLGELECVWANSTFQLDELITLRAFKAEVMIFLESSKAGVNLNFAAVRDKLLKKYEG